MADKEFKDRQKAVDKLEPEVNEFLAQLDFHKDTYTDPRFNSPDLAQADPCVVYFNQLRTIVNETYGWVPNDNV